MDMQARNLPIPSPPRGWRLDDVDLEFRPLVATLLESPPSPIHMRLMTFICALFLVALVGTWLGHIDIYAVAPARIQPTGRSKVIQPLEAGKVLAVHVTNGTRV